MLNDTQLLGIFAYFPFTTFRSVALYSVKAINARISVIISWYLCRGKKDTKAKSFSSLPENRINRLPFTIYTKCEQSAIQRDTPVYNLHKLNTPWEQYALWRLTQKTCPCQRLFLVIFLHSKCCRYTLWMVAAAAEWYTRNMWVIHIHNLI